MFRELAEIAYPTEFAEPAELTELTIFAEVPLRLVCDVLRGKSDASALFSAAGVKLFPCDRVSDETSVLFWDKTGVRKGDMELLDTFFMVRFCSSWYQDIED